MLEKTIEQAVCAYAKQHGVLVTKFTSPGYRGVPDRIFWVGGGRPLLIEFKRPGAVMSSLQGYVKAKLEYLGYAVKTIYSIEEGKKAIEQAIAAARKGGRTETVCTKGVSKGGDKGTDKPKV